MCERSRSSFGKRFLLRKYSFLIQTNDWRAGTHSVYVCGIIPFSNIAVQSSCVRWFPFRYGNGAADIDPAQDCCLGQHQNGCVDVTPNRPAVFNIRTRHDAQRGTTNNVERNEHWLLYIGSDVVYKSGCVLSCDNICSGLSADLRPRRVFHFPLFFHYNIQIQRKPKIDIFDTADTRVLTLSFCLSLVPVQCSIIPATEQS